jgi:Cation transporting ATPase, C-terminus
MSRPPWVEFGGVIALRVLVVSVPCAQELFETRNLSLWRWALAAGVGAVVVVSRRGRHARRRCLQADRTWRAPRGGVRRAGRRPIPVDAVARTAR